MSRVRELFLNLTSTAGTYLALKPAVVGALGTANPACQFVLGALGVGLGVFSTYQAFVDWAQGKKLDEMLDEMNRLILPTVAGFRGAAEELAIDNPLLLRGLPMDDRRRPFLIVFNMIQKGIDDADRFQQQIVDLFEQHLGWEHEIAAFLQSEFETLHRELDFTRDDLVDIAKGLHKLSSDMQRMLEQTRHAPPLLLPVEVYLRDRHQKSIVRFVYRMRRVPILGRRHDSLKLWRFLHTRKTNPPSLLWWLWTGAAGIGKSRLAYEFALTARAAGWWTGLLDEGSKFERWHDWQPDRPTLIVVDYVARRAETTGQIIANLYDRRVDLEHPVRLLLLERRYSPEDNWYQQFEHRESGSKRASIESARYAEPYDLQELDDDSLYDVMRRIFSEYDSGPPAQQAALTALKRIDPHPRPLLAAMLAEVLVRDPDASHGWDATFLTQAILEREVAHWKTLGVDAAHVNLAALATLAGEQPRESSARLAAEGLPVPDGKSFNDAQVATIGGFSGAHDTETMCPLQPDLLAECFVLERLAGRLRVEHTNAGLVREETTALLEPAWQNSPEAMSDFLVRAVQNFPDHEKLETVIAPPAGDAQKVLHSWARGAARAFATLTDPVKNNISDALWQYLTLLKSDTFVAEQRAAAVGGRAVGKAKSGDHAGAIVDFTAVIDMPEATADQKAQTFYNRGVSKGVRGDKHGEIADYTALIEMPDAPTNLKALALFNRGVRKGESGNKDGEITDYTAVIDMPDVPSELKAEALYNRGVEKGGSGDTNGAIADYTALIEMPDAPIEMKARSLGNRGVAKRASGDKPGAIADYTALIEMPDASAEQKARALVNRGVAKLTSGDKPGAIDDHTTVMDMPDASPEQRARAVYNRGVAKRESGDSNAAIADYTTVIDMPEAPTELKVKALHIRGVSRGNRGDFVGAIADFTAVIEMEDPASDQRMNALVNRGIARGRSGDHPRAIIDFTSVISMDSVAPNWKAKAVYNRAVGRNASSDRDGAVADYRSAIQMKETSIDQNRTALLELARLLSEAGETVGACEALRAAEALFKPIDDAENGATTRQQTNLPGCCDNDPTASDD